MKQKNFEINGFNPLELFGINHQKLDYIKRFFPGLKITSRGNELSVSGDDERLDFFEIKFNLFVQHILKYNTLSEQNIDDLMVQEEEETNTAVGGEVLVHGNGGQRIVARTQNQRKLVEYANENDMVFAVGPAGTGKTYTAVALAVRALKNKEVKRIILTRPAVEAGENLGFLPGDLKEKLDPYMMPLYDALRDMLSPEKLADYLETHVIEIAPLAFMRGRTLDKAFVILDEAQNATQSQMKMFLTRMGRSAKFIITGDVSQVDLPYRQKSGLIYALTLLENIEGIGIVRLNQNDVIRHKLVRKIIDAFDKAENHD
ncbi:MAG: PhoH family protein [Crocinitomicaceae bacterium]